MTTISNSPAGPTFPVVDPMGSAIGPVERPTRSVYDHLHLHTLLAPFRAIDREGKKIGARLYHFFDDLSQAIGEVFSRLIHGKQLDLCGAETRELLNTWEANIPLIEEQIAELPFHFIEAHSILLDLRKLQQVDQEVQGTLRKLNEFIRFANRHTPPLAVAPRLLEVRTQYNTLFLSLTSYIDENHSFMIEKFIDVYKIFSRDLINMPLEIKKDFNETWQIFKKILLYYIPNADEREELLTLDSLLRPPYLNNRALPPANVSIQSPEPLRLRNIGNSCYLDSVLQAFFCLEDCCETLKQPITMEMIRKDEIDAPAHHIDNPTQELRNRLIIQNEILHFIDNNKSREYPPMEYMISLLNKTNGPSLFRLRQAIFKSGWHPEFSVRNYIADQYDAASAAELFIDKLFHHYQYKAQYYSATTQMDGLIFRRGVASPESLVKIPINRPRGSIPNVSLPLEMLLSQMLQLHVNRDVTTFDRANGTIVNAEKASAISEDSVRVHAFREWTKFTELPEVLTLQLIRFNALGQKINQEVDLPSLGMLDLAPYCERAFLETCPQVKYEVMSYVVHYGSSLKGGHYIACVRKGGKYWECDDTNPHCYREITREEFLGRKDAYLVVLKRLPQPTESTLDLAEQQPASL